LIAVAAAQGRGWLERERLNITRLVRLASERGLHRAAWQLARACSRFFYLAGYGDDLAQTHRWGLVSARAAGDADAAGWLHNFLAAGDYRAGRFAQAKDHLLAAIGIHEATGVVDRAAVARIQLGTVYSMMGDFPHALRECGRAHDVMRRAQNVPGIAHALLALSEVHRLSGRLTDALPICRRLLFLARALGDPYHLALATGNLGAVRARLGHYRPAMRLLTVSLALKRKAGNRFGEAETLNDIAWLWRARGQPERALPLHHDALYTMREIGDRHGENVVLNDLAETLRVAGQPVQAAETYRQALTLAERNDYPFRRADAHHGLGNCLADSQPEQARQQWELALRLYRRLDVPQQHQVEALLTVTTPQPVGASQA